MEYNLDIDCFEKRCHNCWDENPPPQPWTGCNLFQGWDEPPLNLGHDKFQELKCHDQPRTDFERPLAIDYICFNSNLHLTAEFDTMDQLEILHGL